MQNHQNTPNNPYMHVKVLSETHSDIGQGLVVNFTHIAALRLVEASKFRQIVHMCSNHKVNTYNK